MLAPLIFAAATQGAAAAVPQGDTPVAELPSAHAYRSGLVVGLSLGSGLAGASGYPNTVQQIGNPDYYSASGLMAGASGTVFVLAAFSDYLSFGLWYGRASLGNADWHATGDGGGFRIETFPLLGVWPGLRGLGVFASLGIGSGKLDSAAPGYPEAGGTQSYAGVGVFHEWAFGRFLGGHFAAGPELEFDGIWSQPFEEHGLFASGRLTFYGGP